jgi:hypothetical protein
MPSREESAKAGVSDVSDWGEKDTAAAYPPGTTFDLGDGKPIDISKVPDVIGGKGSKSAAD